MKMDFIIIGSGLAGLTSSLVLQKYGEVLLVTKGKIKDCSTDLAQGGICSVVEEEDSFESHIEDTLIAGAYHNNHEVVEYMVKNAPLAIDWLVVQGVRFERKNDRFSPTKEAAHSHSRILHATDFTGAEIERALVEKVNSAKNITVWQNCFALDLLVRKGECSGVQVIKGEKIISLFTRVVIIATGGLGQLFRWTTDPKVTTGDGLAIAARAGTKLADLEFIQFHPTAFKHGRSPLFLLTEALRGEGGYLVDERGERFLKKIDKRAELAPRDIVARAVFAKQKTSEVYLDIRHKGEFFLKKRFPNIYKRLKEEGFDLAYDLIPVTPAAHYLCGGIKVDLCGRTNIKNLFAFGEVAGSGAQGANRLASNSLLEAVVFPLRLKKCLGQLPKTVKEEAFPIGNLDKTEIETGKIRKELQKLMWEKVGIVRTRKRMKEALEKIEEWESEMAENKTVNKELMELKNMILLARLVTTAALARKKSLGAHFVRD